MSLLKMIRAQLGLSSTPAGREYKSGGIFQELVFTDTDANFLAKLPELH